MQVQSGVRSDTVCGGGNTGFPQSGQLFGGKMRRLFVDNTSQGGKLVRSVSEKLSSSPRKLSLSGHEQHSHDYFPSYSVDGSTRYTPDGRICSLVPMKVTECNNNHGELQALRQTIAEHEQKLSAMHRSVTRLEEDSAHVQRRVVSLRKKVNNHEQVFRSTLTQTQRSLQEHADTLVKLQRVSQVLLKSRRSGNSSMMDTGIFMLTFYIVQTPLIKYTLYIVSRFFPRSHIKHRKWFSQMIRILLMYQLYNILRYINHRAGLSSRLYSSTKWMTNLIKNASWNVMKFISFRESPKQNFPPGLRPPCSDGAAAYPPI